MHVFFSFPSHLLVGGGGGGGGMEEFLFWQSLSHGHICSASFACCHTEIQVADQLSVSPSHGVLTPG